MSKMPVLKPCPLPGSVLQLVQRFAQHQDTYKKQSYNEMQVRREFIDPFFEALGWDVDNRAGLRTRVNVNRPSTSGTGAGRYMGHSAKTVTHPRTEPNTVVGSKWLCVVIKHTEADAFVLTAYLTDRPKKGDVVWRSE